MSLCVSQAEPNEAAAGFFSFVFFYYCHRSLQCWLSLHQSRSKICSLFQSETETLRKSPPPLHQPDVCESRLHFTSWSRFFKKRFHPLEVYSKFKKNKKNNEDRLFSPDETVSCSSIYFLSLFPVFCFFALFFYKAQQQHPP